MKERIIKEVKRHPLKCMILGILLISIPEITLLAMIPECVELLGFSLLIGMIIITSIPRVKERREKKKNK